MNPCDDDQIARDGEVLRTSIYTMDAPGQRTAPHPADRALADAIARLEATYDARDAALMDAWKR